MFDVTVYDGLVKQSQRDEVWKYINDQEWYATWKKSPPMDKRTGTYIPSKSDNSWYNYQPQVSSMWMHRTCFASDDYSLEHNHPVIWKLWQTINASLGDRFYIGGDPEQMAVPEDDLKWLPPSPRDPSLKQGWRVYSGGQLREGLKNSHGVHRDTIDLAQDKHYTILYYANPVWYPTWFAENIFYPEDPEGLTKDHQQFQAGHAQGRNFNIGWADQGKIVSPVPGRVVVYDGRTLHTTRPAAVWCKEIRKVIAFRVSLKD
jgi:hypothetical protein